MMTFVEHIQTVSKQEGVLLGVEIGVKKGVKQGAEQERKRLFRHMLRNGISVEAIAHMTGGPLGQIISVKESMEEDILRNRCTAPNMKKRP